MGEIKKQGISNSIIIMLGAVIGAFNVLFLFPKILPEEYFGLTRVMVELTYILVQFGLIGGYSTIIRFWSRITDPIKLFQNVIRPSLLFSGIILILLLLFKDFIVSFYIDKSPLIVEYYNGLFILFLATIIFEYFSAVSIGLLKTQVPIFLKEVFIRLYITLLIFLYYYKFVEESVFIYLFVLGYVVIGLIMLFYVLKQKNVLKKSHSIISPNNNHDILKYRVASFFSSFSSGIVNRLDVIMIATLVSNEFVLNQGLSSVAIYSIALYTSTIIEIPSRGMFAISAPIISQSWAENKQKEIASIYKKSSINLFVVALLLFGLLALNVDEFLSFLKESFMEAKTAILILGFAKVFNMLLGVNNIILTTSKYYLIGAYTMVGLIFITFLLNYILIPIYGVNGAAIGSLVSLVVYNLVSLLFLWIKFNIQPFSLNTLKAFFIAVIAYYCTHFIELENVYLAIVSKTMVFSILYLISIYSFKISSDIINVVDQFVIKYVKRN